MLQMDEVVLQNKIIINVKYICIDYYISYYKRITSIIKNVRANLYISFKQSTSTS